jgi:hypothetical protein
VEITEQEQQLIEILREQEGRDFSLTIGRQDGAWEVAFSVAPHDARNESRGVGASFAEAWDGMSPLWADRESGLP